MKMSLQVFEIEAPQTVVDLYQQIGHPSCIGTTRDSIEQLDHNKYMKVMILVIIFPAYRHVNK